MSWVREMEQDAVAIAFPDWSWSEDDVVTIDNQWEEAGGYSEYTQWSADYEIVVAVWRDGDDWSGYHPDARRVRSYSKDEAVEFWAALMKRGSER